MNPIAAITATPEKTPIVQQPADGDMLRWQRRMLPFMTRFVVAMAAAFFCFSGVLLYEVTSFIEAERGQDIRLTIQSEIAKPPAATVSSEDVTNDSLLLLEADALNKRYREASALLLSRIWSRQLAFITGMVLAFVGAVFILGKLSESSSHISGGANGWQVGISSASPGIILSFFGTVLLVSALFSKATLDVSDGPAYVNVLRQRPSAPALTVGPSGKAADSTQPLDLNQLQQLDKKKAPPVQKSE
jgi:hypothetical protein